MKNLLSFARTAAAGLSLGAACVKPPPPENQIPVTIVDIPPIEEIQAPVQPKKVQETEGISATTRDKVFEECFLEEPHKQCVKDEGNAFFELANKLHPDLRQSCINGVNYDRECLDKTFQNVFSGQVEHESLLTIKSQCKYLLESCIHRKITKQE